MEVENQLSMSLDDIINKNKKQRPVGSGKQQMKPGAKAKQSPKVFKSPKNLSQSGKGKQSGNNSKVRVASQKNFPGFGKNRSTQGAIRKPSHQGPSTQSNKAKQGSVPKVVFNEAKRKSPAKPLKITIQNDVAQRPVLPGPVIAMPTQGRLAMPSQVQLPRSQSMQMAGAYTAAAQPRRTQQAYVAASAPARQAYTDNVGRGVNNAASYLRQDPYRGADFEPRTLGGMRSDNSLPQQARQYESLLDDELREDNGRQRTNAYYNGRQSNRERSTYRH